ncbi:MAG: PAS domain-containing protein [Acidimicrobiales bacterium]
MWSGNAQQSLGLAPEAFGTDPEAFLAVIHPEDREEHRALVLGAAGAGGDVQNEFRVMRPDGEVRWVEVRGRVITDTRGDPRSLIGVAADVTDRRLIDEIRGRLLEREHRARIEAEDARERLALVAEVSAALTSTLDPQAAYELIARLVVPRLCDWCVVDSVDDAGDLLAVAIAHRDPAVVDDVRAALERRQAAGGDGIWSVRRAIREARSEMVVEITDDDLAVAAADDDHLTLLRGLAPDPSLWLRSWPAVGCSAA